MKTRNAVLSTLLASVLISSAALAVAPTPVPGFTTRTVATQDGATIYVRSGGHGPAVVLIHGFGDTGDMWGPLALQLAKTHLVIVPDLRGMGRSSKAPGGYDKKSQWSTSGQSSPRSSRTTRPSSVTTSARWWLTH